MWKSWSFYCREIMSLMNSMPVYACICMLCMILQYMHVHVHVHVYVHAWEIHLSTGTCKYPAQSIWYWIHLWYLKYSVSFLVVKFTVLLRAAACPIECKVHTPLSMLSISGQPHTWAMNVISELSPLYVCVCVCVRVYSQPFTYVVFRSSPPH